MHSFVARLRGRAISQTTTNSNLSEELDTPDTPTSPHSTLPATSDPQTAIIDRKILPQVNELLESYSIQEHADVVGEQSSGLSPRPLRRGPYEPAGAEAGETSSESAIPSERRGSIARISRRFTSSTPWSTFGRTTASPRRTPRSDREGPPSSMRFHFGSVDTFAAPRPSRSSVSIAHVGTDSPGSASHTRRPSRASEASSWRFGSLRGRSYSLNAMSQDPVQSSRPTSASGGTSVKDSATTTSSASTNTHAHTPIISPTNMPSASDSRYTFGNTSPSLHLSAFVTPSTSPIPNMDTPEFINTLTIHSRPSLRDTTNSTPPSHDAIPPLRHWTSSLAAKTFPPRRRRKTVGGESDENTLPFPSTSGRRLRTSASAPGVRHIFQHQPPTPKSKRRQASSKSSRRSSADWSARQASAGVTSNVIGEYGWPAQVSREMIRLSLGEQAAASKDKVAGKRPVRESANPDISQRGHNVPRSSQVAGRPCPPLLSPNSSPPKLEGDSESGDKPSWTQDVQTDIPVFNKPGGVVEGQSSMSARNGVELSTLKEEGDDARQAMTLPRAATGNRVYRKSILRHSSSLNPQDSEAGPSSLETPLTSTPKESRRSSARRPARYASEPSIGQIPETPLKNKGKRKAEDLDLTPPDHRSALQHTTFVIPSDHRRTHRQSEPSRIAPSAYQHKRVRLSSQSPAPTPSHSRPGSSLQQANPNVTDSPSYRLSTPPSPAVRAMSRATSTRSMQPSVAGPAQTPSLSDSRRERRRSVSEVSFPIGAIVSPQPPSISRSSTYHMRDPRRPPRIHSTSWIPHFKSEDEEASSIHAWLFYISFILFPLWWAAALLPIPRTRHVGGSDTEKAVPLDDPQIEHDARSWRFRCRIMAGISFLTYIPFIVLVAVFAPR